MTTVEQVDVVGIGLNVTDTLIPVKQFPERGSKIEIHSANALLGGQVASAMAAWSAGYCGDVRQRWRAGLGW